MYCLTRLCANSELARPAPFCLLHLLHCRIAATLGAFLPPGHKFQFSCIPPMPAHRVLLPRGGCPTFSSYFNRSSLSLLNSFSPTSSTPTLTRTSPFHISFNQHRISSPFQTSSFRSFHSSSSTMAVKAYFDVTWTGPVIKDTGAAVDKLKATSEVKSAWPPSTFINPSRARFTD